MNGMSRNFYEDLEKKKVLIANHRGTFGGSIIENTIDSFNLAVEAGADIVEFDIIRSKDGKYYVYHDTEEKRTLGFANNIHAFTSEEIESMTYVNRYGFKTSRKIDTLEEVLDALKGRCYFNLDRCAKYGFPYLKRALDIIAKKDMFGQLLLKTSPTEELLSGIENYGVPMMYMPIVSTEEKVERTLARKINTVALELLFKTDEDPLVSPANLKKWKESGINLWVNTICIDERYVMSGGHNDNVALCGDKQGGWGNLVDRGFNILQTDWPYFRNAYLKEKVGGER